MSYANLILKILMADASVHDNPNTPSKLWHMGHEELRGGGTSPLTRAMVENGANVAGCVASKCQG